jgi:hypothetical protein
MESITFSLHNADATACIETGGMVSVKAEVKML